MTIETSNDFDNLVDRTEAAVEKFRESADGLRDEIGEAKAAAKVKYKAMIARLDHKHTLAKDRLAELKREGEGSLDQLDALHERLVTELTDMKRTIARRLR
jgi:hypothetical protein